MQEFSWYREKGGSWGGVRLFFNRVLEESRSLVSGVRNRTGVVKEGFFEGGRFLEIERNCVK